MEPTEFVTPPCRWHFGVQVMPLRNVTLGVHIELPSKRMNNWCFGVTVMVACFAINLSRAHYLFPGDF